MKRTERSWYRDLAETGERLAAQTGLTAECGFRLLEMALAWRLLAEVGAPVTAKAWPQRWQLAKAWGGELFDHPPEWAAKIGLCASLLDEIMDRELPVTSEYSLAFVHQLLLEHRGEGRQQARKTKGSYYTPVPIVDQLLAGSLDPWITSWKRRWQVAAACEKDLLCSELAALRIMDPACGAGAFLLAAWERLTSCWQMAGDPHPARAALQNLLGWEQDRGAVHILMVLVSARLYAVGEPTPAPAFQIKIGDFLRYLPSNHEQITLVVGNPPWVRAKYSLNGSEAERKASLSELRVAFPELAVGELNLYTLFISRALDWLAPGGILAFITPNSFLLDWNSEGLRRRLLDSCLIRDLVPLGEREGRQLFGGICQASVLLTLERSLGAITGASEVQNLWMELPHSLMVSGSPVEIGLLNRLLRHPTIAEHFIIQDGELHLTRGREWITVHSGEGVFPLIRGDGISRGLDQRREYVRLTDALQERWQGLINGRRILLQRIANQHGKRRLKGAIVQGVVAGNSTVALIPKGLSAEGLLAETLMLLQSSLYQWLLRKLSSDNNIPAWKLKMMPWLPPAVLKGTSDPSVIDELVYQMFGLSSEEKQLVYADVNIAKNHAG